MAEIKEAFERQKETLTSEDTESVNLLITHRQAEVLKQQNIPLGASLLDMHKKYQVLLQRPPSKHDQETFA